MQSSSISWNDVIKKEAKGLNDFSLGEVQSIGRDFVLTEKGHISKEKFYIPKYLVRGFDGKTLWFNVSESQAQTDFRKDNPPATNEYNKYRTTTAAVFIDTVPSL